MLVQILKDGGTSMGDTIFPPVVAISILDTVCAMANIPAFELSQKKKSQSQPYVKYYDYETRCLVAEMYSRDIDRFGYEFGR